MLHITPKNKKIKSRLPLGSPIRVVQKKRAPSLLQHFCLVEIRSNKVTIAGSRPIKLAVASSSWPSWLPAVFLFTSNHYESARAS